MSDSKKMKLQVVGGSHSERLDDGEEKTFKKGDILEVEESYGKELMKRFVNKFRHVELAGPKEEPTPPTPVVEGKVTPVATPAPAPAPAPAPTVTPGPARPAQQPGK